MERLNATKKTVMLSLALIAALAIIFTAFYAVVGSPAKVQAEASSDPLYDLLGFGIYPRINKSESEGGSTVVDDPEDAIDNYTEYVSGICSTSKDLPVIILRLEGENMADLSNVRYYYRIQENIDEVAAGEEWRQIEDDVTTDMYAVFYTDTLVNPGDYFRKYVFFKTVVNEAGVGQVGSTSQEYVSPKFIDLIIDRSLSDNAYAINSISATYHVNGADIKYDTDEPAWVSTYVTFTLSSNSNTVDNTAFKYSYQTRINENTGLKENVWLPANTVLNSEGKYEAVINIGKVANTDADIAYSGEVLFCSSDKANTNEQVYNASRKYVKVDTYKPVFEVQAKMNGGKDDYNYGSGTSSSDNHWSSTDVTYTLNPVNICISGAEYYYNLNNEYIEGKQVWTKIVPKLSGGEYVYQLTLTESVSHLKFKAESNAGQISSHTTDYITNIDKVEPELNLYAADNNSKQITSGGYASDVARFTLSNNALNKSQVEFEYKIKDESENWQKISKTGDNYVYSIGATVVDRVYIFRAVSRAGLADEQEFKVSVLSSNFTMTMDEPIIETNEAGWACNKIAIYLNLPSVLGIDEINAIAEEYDFYSAVYGDNTTEKEVIAYLVDDAYIEGGLVYNKYKIEIDTSLNGNIMTFYALNKARDKSVVLSTEAIKLDLKNPVGTVVSRIYNSTVVLGDDDWANGRVVVEITPETNISGLSCYPLLGSGPYVLGREITLDDGKFSYSVTSTGVYRFCLISGAGRTMNGVLSNRDSIARADLEVPVNIDTGDITFESIIVKVDGEVIDPYSTTISSDAEISFVSNQAGHFNYYWQTYTGGSPLDDAYVLGTGETYTFSPVSDGSGEVQLAFYLESKAVSALGTRFTTAPLKTIIKYDVTEFEIEVTWDTLTDWRSAPVEFNFINSSTVKIKAYQMKLDGGDWQTIISDAGVTSYQFDGVAQYTSDGKYLGKAYNGQIYFRALNSAGHPSVTVGDEIFIKLDTTTPSPVNAIKQAKGGEIVYDSADDLNLVYSYEAIRYVETNGNSAEPVFENLAPITYFYKLDTGSENAGSISESDCTVLSGATILEGRYWLGAKNEFTNNVTFELYYFIVEETAPTATLSGGTLNPTSGLYEFNWQESITVSILADSETSVYYWYKIGNNDWVRYNDIADDKKGELQTIVFLGQADANYPDAIVGNMDETVRFKISNLSGSEYEIDDRIRVKIDTDSPRFVIETSINNETIEEADRNKWYSDAIYLRLTPDGSYNPGGVIYKYRTDGAGENYERLPGDGTFFSTDDLITYSGNGKVTIYIRATARATGDSYDQQVTLYVDKVLPDFDLIGEITVNDTANTKTIVSGEWAQADEVRITKSLKQEAISEVTFTYTSSLNPTAAPDVWPDTSPTRVITQICVITVTATNQAGLSVTKTFEVNIDNDAPIINSGIIKNKMRQIADGTYVIDTENPYRYYIDQVITYVEPNLKSAKYNNFPLANGQIIATNTVDNSNGGYVHIVIEDMAGNVSELVFYMTIFDLTVNTITLADDDIALLESFENDYNNLKSSLTTSRQEYFAATISRLWDRVATLEKQVEDYQKYLETINSRVAFDLKSDYEEMATYINYFTTADTSIRYPEWEQKMITTPSNTYGAYYQKLLSEFAKLEQLMEGVKKVQEEAAVLPATNVVERGDYSDIVRVYNAYNSLTVDQKSVFLSTLYTKITELKRSCEVLLLQDESTGINISGDDLAAGVTIEVENYEKTTELVNNAQLSLLESYAEGEARAIITVSKISLSGYGSQYDTGDIVITLPIPDEYQSYIKFAVYKLSSDGTLTVMDGVTINGDGKSVYFETDALGTFVLAANANTTVRQQSEKIYGKLGDVEIDGTLLSYITYAACALAGLLIIILIIVAIKQKWFLRIYNKAHRRNLVKRGMDYIPKGNDPSRTNPAYPPEKFDYRQRIYEDRPDKF